MISRILWIPTLTALTLLTGCAAPGLYQWSGYDQALYSGYKDVTKMEALRTKLEVHVSEMEKSKAKVAPGLYARVYRVLCKRGWDQSFGILPSN
jgi:hypothetical protein